MIPHYTNLLTKYSNWINNQSYSHNTKSNYVKTAEKFLSYLSDFNIINLKDAGTERTLSFLTKRGAKKYAKAYFNLRLSSLSLFYAWAYTNKYCLTNPIVQYKKSKIYPKLSLPKKLAIANDPIVLSSQEQQLLLTLKTDDVFTTKRNKFIMALILTTALYADEIIHLSYKDLNMEKGTIRISKNNQSSRIISIDDKLQKVCHEWLAMRSSVLHMYNSPWLFVTNKAKPISKRILYRIIANCMQNAGINKDHLGPEILRQTAIANMLNSGLTLEEIQTITGIKTLKNIQRYQNK